MPLEDLPEHGLSIGVDEIDSPSRCAPLDRRAVAAVSPTVATRVQISPAGLLSGGSESYGVRAGSTRVPGAQES